MSQYSKQTLKNQKRSTAEFTNLHTTLAIGHTSDGKVVF